MSIAWNAAICTQRMDSRRTHRVTVVFFFALLRYVYAVCDVRLYVCGVCWCRSHYGGLFDVYFFKYEDMNGFFCVHVCLCLWTCVY